MTREVSRRKSQAAPEDKDPRAIRPDVVGKRRLNERIVEDREDPAMRGKAMDGYLGSITPTEGR